MVIIALPVKPIGMITWHVNNTELVLTSVKMIKNLWVLLGERILKSVRDVNFGLREVRDVITWLVGVELNFVINVVGLIENASVEGIKIQMMMMISEEN